MCGGGATLLGVPTSHDGTHGLRPTQTVYPRVATVALAAGAATPGCMTGDVVSLITSGLRTNSARMAASRSHPTATQKTGIQEPAASTSLAAPQPAKIEAVPLAVYWTP